MSEKGSSTLFWRPSCRSFAETWLLVAVGGSLTRGLRFASVETSERETNGLVGLGSAARANRCRAASKASFARARAAERGVGLVGEALSAPFNRRMLGLWVGVVSSS